jgi:TIR domain
VELDHPPSPSGTGRIFVSYVEEDGSVAQAIAAHLEKRAFRAWYYQRDSLPGPTYVQQVLRSIESADALLLILSPRTLASRQVGIEIIHGHESGKALVPILAGITFDELRARKPEWAVLLGGAVATPLRSNLETTANEVVRGLAMLLAKPEPAPVPTEPARTTATDDPSAGTFKRSFTKPTTFALVSGVATLAGVIAWNHLRQSTSDPRALTPNPNPPPAKIDPPLPQEREHSEPKRIVTVVPDAAVPAIGPALQPERRRNRTIDAKRPPLLRPPKAAAVVPPAHDPTWIERWNQNQQEQERASEIQKSLTGR